MNQQYRIAQQSVCVCVSKWEREMLEVCIFLITGWCTKLNSEFYDIQAKLCVVFFI